MNSYCLGLLVEEARDGIVVLVAMVSQLWGVLVAVVSLSLVLMVSLL